MRSIRCCFSSPCCLQTLALPSILRCSFQDSSIMAGYNGGVVGVVVSTFVLTLISVILRVVARRITHVHLWWDDHFAIVALLFSIAWCSVVMVCEYSRFLQPRSS